MRTGHEEADTPRVIDAKHAVANHPPVTVTSDDTDVFVILHTYIHTHIRVFCIAHINSIESLCASVAKQVSFQRLFESVK